MGDATKEKPKCLAELNGRILLSYQIEALRAAGIKDIAIVRGYSKEKINVEGVTYFDNMNWEHTNMIMSLMCAAEFFTDEPCIVSYSDIVYQKEAAELLVNCEHDIAITYNTNWLDLWKMRFEDPLSDAETFKISEAGVVTEIGNKTTDINEICGQYMGLLRFTSKGFNTVKEYIYSLEEQTRNKMDMTRLLSNLIERNVRVYGIPYSGLWLEADNQNDIKLYEEKFLLT